MKKPGNVDLVYNAKNAYWLASPCVYANFGYGFALFRVRCVDSTSVHATYMCVSNGDSDYVTCAVCPVVSLKSNIQVTRDTGETEWEIK